MPLFEPEDAEDVLLEVAREVAHEHLLELLDVRELLGVDRPRADGQGVGHHSIMTHLVGICHTPTRRSGARVLADLVQGVLQRGPEAPGDGR